MANRMEKAPRAEWEFVYSIYVQVMHGYIPYMQWDADESDAGQLRSQLFCNWSGAERGRVSMWVAERWERLVGQLNDLIACNGSLSDAGWAAVESRIQDIERWVEQVPAVAGLVLENRGRA